jgi:hypothetical protein
LKPQIKLQLTEMQGEGHSSSDKDEEDDHSSNEIRRT